MVKFLDSEKLLDALDSIFEDAEEFLYVVSPYIKLDRWLKENIENVRASEFKVVYGKTWMHNKSHNFISEFEDIELYYHSDLHAKVYINEREALVSSMNLYDYSMDNNIECGVLIPSNEKAYQYVLSFVEKVIRSSDKIYST